jgi:glycosyltransferase involved in cell wall biosynthesis
MRAEPTVGVIMPTHGRGAYLREAVETVLAQTFDRWQLTIVCDGATEEAARHAEACAAGDARIRVVRQARAGVAAARNRGLDELSPAVDCVALLDHDDRWLPGTLATLTRALQRAPERFVGAHGIARTIDGAGALLRPGVLESELRRRQGVLGGRLVESPPGQPTTFAHLVFTCCIPVGTALIRRSALARAGRFDERAVPADDYDMWTRLARLGEFAFVDEVVLEYRRHGQPTWVRPRGVGRGSSYVRRKIVASPDNTPEQADTARRGYRLCAALTVRHAAFEAIRSGVRSDLRAAARHLLTAALHLGAYVRGGPGPWHGR